MKLLITDRSNIAMIKDAFNGKIYQSFNGDELLLTIENTENNIYRAINEFTDITAEIIPLDEFRTQVSVIEYKKADKNGKFRRYKKHQLMNHDQHWLLYMLEKSDLSDKPNRQDKKVKEILFLDRVSVFAETLFRQ